MSRYGISLYLGTGEKKNGEVVRKAKEAGASFAFTSLHIPEENVGDYAAQVRKLLDLCRSCGISLLVDIGPRTLQKLGLRTIEDLGETAITHVRVDYGFSLEEIAGLTRSFHVVFNASTFPREQIPELRRLGADMERLSACHNFYPKPLTGLSPERTRRVNESLHRYGIETMAFVAGDRELRGPLHQGLPTVEAHRTGDVLLHLLELTQACSTDVCLIGDIDVTPRVWRGLSCLTQGYVPLRAEIRPEYAFLRDIVHHDRPDSSEYVIRSQESRGYAAQGTVFAARPCAERKKGSISVGNEKYLRYSGELEIARTDLPPEERVNVVGQVGEESLPYLTYITDGMGFRLAEPSGALPSRTEP